MVFATTLTLPLSQNGSSMCELVHARPELDVVDDTVVVFDVSVREPRLELVAVGVVPQDALNGAVATQLPDASLRTVDRDTVGDVKLTAIARAFEVVPVFVEGVLAALRALDEVVGFDAKLLPLCDKVADVVLQRAAGSVAVCAGYVVAHNDNIATLCLAVQSAPSSSRA